MVLQTKLCDFIHNIDKFSNQLLRKNHLIIYGKTLGIDLCFKQDER